MGVVASQVIEGIEQETERALRLPSVLRGEAEEDDAAAPDLDLDHGGLALEVLRAEEPAALQGRPGRVPEDFRDLEARGPPLDVECERLVEVGRKFVRNAQRQQRR